MKTSLVAAADARRWQPIETAPQDEPIILAVRDRITRRWIIGEGRWWEEWYLTDEYHRQVEDYDQPTHWQPLPPPPADLNEGPSS